MIKKIILLTILFSKLLFCENIHSGNITKYTYIDVKENREYKITESISMNGYYYIEITPENDVILGPSKIVDILSYIRKKDLKICREKNKLEVYKERCCDCCKRKGNIDGYKK